MSKRPVSGNALEAWETMPTLSQEALTKHPYAAFLAKLEKPGRYLGGEEQCRIKASDDSIMCRFVLAFPDIYEIGMSHLGTRILYSLINDQPDLACERAFSPWKDAEEELRTRQQPLVSLETYRPLAEFDVIGVSLQYELCYTNVLLNLDLGGVTLRSLDRGEKEPIVLAGGPTATHPEPLADFVDAFLVGEAEEVLPNALRAIGEMRRRGAPRLEILGHLARTPGFYVPRFYRTQLDERSGLLHVAGRSEEGLLHDAPFPISRVFVRNLDDFPFPSEFPVPYAQAIFDRASVEITRGCTEGCRFCQAGMIYRPVRERKPEDIIKAVLDTTDRSGFDEASLTALSTADVSCIDPLIKALVPELAKRKVSLGIASLRAYGLNESMLDEIQKVGIDGLTFAPEAGTQRMRNVINKNVSDEDILTSARRIFERGYERMKMYFIMGLPTETEEDVVGIVETGRKVREVAREIRPNREVKITVSVSQHVPKPHTPFQWAAMDPIAELESKIDLLRSKTKRAGVDLKTHSVRESWLECLFARGDRRLGDALERAYQNGARFDGWQDRFRFDVWLEALEFAKIDPNLMTRTIPVDAKLPWDHIDVGLDEGFLAGEYRKSIAGRSSPPCGKPAGSQVHHTTLHGPQGALAEKRRLVCYDCGIACDLSEMREERIEGLIKLEKRRDRSLESESEVAQASAPVIDVSLDRLRGVLGQSKLKSHDVRKENAEAPFSRLRVFYGKVDTLAFMGHLDLVRIFPRMMRRAGLELAFTRGFHALPRMSFAPALALGVAAFEEAVDCDLILEDSADDMLGRWSDEDREKRAEALLAALRQFAPPGLVIRGGRILTPGERKIGDLVAGADYEVQLPADALDDMEAQMHAQLGEEEVIVMRAPKRRKRARNGRRPPPSPAKALNIRPIVQSMRIDRERQTLLFRILSGQEGAKARPREIVEAFTGRVAQEHKMARVRLLGRSLDGELVPLSEMGPMLKRHKELEA